MNIMQNNKKAVLLALLATFFWSTVATAFKFGLEALSPTQFLCWVIIVAWICLTVIGVVLGKWKVKPTKKVLLLGLAGGLLNPFGYYLVLFNAYDMLPAQIAQSLNYTWPLVLVLLSSVFLRQKFRAKVFWGMLISLVGVIIISYGSMQSDMGVNLTGIFLAVGSSLIWASYWIINKISGADPIQQIWLNFTFALVLILPYTYITESVPLPSFETLFTKSWLAVLYAALFEMALTFVIWLKAMQLASSSDKISHYIYISPFLSLVFINLLLKEPILLSTIAGLGFIIGGIIWTEYFNKDNKLKNNNI